MKLQDYSFSQASRKDNALVDFINDVCKILNFGRYQLRISSEIPTYNGEDGEFLIYISGAVRRLYFYDLNSTTWYYTSLTGTTANDLIIPNRTDDPASPAVGQMWYRTDL
jgi:hypothetical protein